MFRLLYTESDNGTCIITCYKYLKYKIYVFRWDVENHEDYTIFYCHRKDILNKFVHFYDPYLRYFKKFNISVSIVKVNSLADRKIIFSLCLWEKFNYLDKSKFYTVMLKGYSSYLKKNIVCIQPQMDGQFLDIRESYIDLYYGNLYLSKLINRCKTLKDHNVKRNILEFYYYSVCRKFNSFKI